jgi:hypothetical protein
MQLVERVRLVLKVDPKTGVGAGFAGGGEEGVFCKFL